MSFEYNAGNYSFANSFNRNENCLKVLHFITILTLKFRPQLEELLNYD